METKTAVSSSSQPQEGPTNQFQGYPSGQIALLKAQGKLLREETSYRIQKIHVYKVDHLADTFPGLTRYPNIFKRTRHAHGKVSYNDVISDDEVVLFNIVRKKHTADVCDSFVRAGPRAYTVFAPGTVNAAIVTCGGLCPGLNDVIKYTYDTLYYNYGVDNIYGIKSGFRGFWDPEFQPWQKLTPENTKDLGNLGGTFLGSSRGGMDIKKITDSLELYGVSVLFIVGGDGTHRGAGELCEEIAKRGLKICVAGIPKTIDNDIAPIDRSFGFNTAVSYAVQAIHSVTTEARCVPNGIGIVQLMGRHAGYIATHSCLASEHVDLCLIPEVPFVLDGKAGILAHIEHVLRAKEHCVVVVAEGAGEDLFKDLKTVQDESGNTKLDVDIGIFLKNRTEQYFSSKNIKVNVKYNNPGYMVRSPPAMAADRIYCLSLSQNAVHGAMAGYTNFTSGLVNNRSVLMPINVITSSSPSSLNPFGRTWERVCSTTHQPNADLVASKQVWDAPKSKM